MKSTVEDQKNAVTDWMIIMVFFGVITSSLFVQIINKASGTESHEKRKLASLPSWPDTWNDLLKFPSQFSAYYGDHFGMRAELIRVHALAMYLGLNISPSDNVIRGKDGWLYYADDYSIEDYRSLQPFSVAELERWKQVLEERQEWLARRGARFLLVLACDKYMIYPEYLPDSLRRAPRQYRVDELANYLQKHSNIPVVSLRQFLEDGKNHDRLYHRTDSHWNDRGAFIGYREIIRAIHEWYPMVEPLPLEAFDLVENTTEGWDLARMIGLNDIVLEEDLQLVPSTPRSARLVDVDIPDSKWNSGRIVMEKRDPALPRALVYRDSFGSALVPFLAEHFNRSIFLWQYEMEVSVIEQEQPDVVILLMASRRMQWYIPANPPLP